MFYCQYSNLRKTFEATSFQIGCDNTWKEPIPQHVSLAPIDDVICTSLIQRLFIFPNSSILSAYQPIQQEINFVGKYTFLFWEIQVVLGVSLKLNLEINDISDGYHSLVLTPTELYMYANRDLFLILSMKQSDKEQEVMVSSLTEKFFHKTYGLLLKYTVRSVDWLDH